MVSTVAFEAWVARKSALEKGDEEGVVSEHLNLDCDGLKTSGLFFCRVPWECPEFLWEPMTETHLDSKRMQRLM